MHFKIFNLVNLSMFGVPLLACLGITIIIKIIRRAIHVSYVSNVKITEKVVIVTGSNTGVGYVTAEDLARRGAKVILACRDPQRGLAARDNIIQSTGNKKIIFKQLDLSSFKSVRDFSNDVLKSESRLDILINNAGILNVGNYLTEDKLPIEAQINHFSPFLLTMLLLPLLKLSSPSRIINVSSIFYIFGNVDGLHKQTQCSVLGRYVERVYSNTKLANILFTRKLSEYLKNTGITASCLHPGAVSSELYRNRRFTNFWFSYFINLTAKQGAQTSIYLAVDPSLDSVSGKYFSNCREVTPIKKARDDKAAEKLWALSENIVFGKNKEL